MNFVNTSDPDAFNEKMQVSHGLNLWLSLKTPDSLNRLIVALLETERLAQIRSALRHLNYVHFARFLPSREGNALQVITEFDGELDAYVMDFALAIGDTFNLIMAEVKGWNWGNIQDHPAEFLQFIKENNRVIGGEIPVFSAYPNRTVLDIVGPRHMLPPKLTPTPRTAVDLADIQANILRSVHTRLASHLAFSWGDDAGGKAFLGRLITGDGDTPTVSNAQIWDAQKPPVHVTVGLTCRGIVAAAPDTKLVLCANFQAFANGPASRADKFGDTQDSAPSSAPSDWIFGRDNQRIAMMLSVYADDQDVLQKTVAALLASAAECSANLEHRQDAEALAGDKLYFGYADGLSQPRLAIAGWPQGDADMQPEAGVGEFLLGEKYSNIYGGADSLGGLPADIANNASFAAIRMMAQNVAGFETLLDQGVQRYGVDREWLAAKLMGRWRDGTPTTQSPHSAIDAADAPLRNNFDYAPSFENPSTFDDHQGARCPVSSHIRRMNPRSAQVAGRPHSRRLIRRGMPYHMTEGDVETQGLFGVFICADLERQFEFLLATWANTDFAASGIRGMQDPIIGAQTATDGRDVQAEFRCLAPDGVTEIRLALPRLVTTRGSLYLLMPGLEGLKKLAGEAKVEHKERKALAIEWSGAYRFQDMAETLTLVDAINPDTFDPQSDAFLANPYPFYEKFRTSHPVALISGADRQNPINSYWVFSHALAAEVCSKPEVYVRKNPNLAPDSAGILNMDPPAHPNMRKAIMPLIDAVVATLSASAAETSKTLCKLLKGSVDWNKVYGQPLGQAMFQLLMGIDAQFGAALATSVNDAFKAHRPGDLTATQTAMSEKFGVIGKQFFFNKPPTLSAGKAGPLIAHLAILPLEDTVSNQPYYDKHDVLKLVQIASAQTVEYAANATSLAMAGFKTLEWLIGNVTYNLLLDDAKQLKILKTYRQAQGAGFDMNAVVEELLRFDTPLPLVDRYAKEAVTLGGVKIPQGARLTLVFGSANRDTAVFGSSANTINFERTEADGKKLGMGFGYGSHSCLGKAMAYTVVGQAIRTLLDATTEPKLEAGFKPRWSPMNDDPYFHVLEELKIVV